MDNKIDNHKFLRLKEVLKEKRMTQLDLASKTNLSKQYICDIANHRTQISLKRLYEFAIVLDVDVSDLLEPVQKFK